MSSQEEYLDQLLRNIMGENDQPQPESDTEGVSASEMAEGASGEMTGMSDEPESFGMGGIPGMSEAGGMANGTMVMPEMYEMPVVSSVNGMPEIVGVDGMLGMSEMTGAPDSFEAMPEQDEMPEVSGMPEIAGVGGMLGMPEMTGTPNNAAVMSGQDEMSGMSEMSKVSGMPEMPEVSGVPEMFEVSGMPEMSEISGMPEMSEVSGRSRISGMGGMPEWTVSSEMLGDFEDNNDILGTPVEDTNLDALLRSIGDDSTVLGEKVADDSESTNIFSLSEEDVDRLLAKSKGMSEDSKGSTEESFQGDVVDMLKGTEDSELREIQDLLVKSDNNEAVGDEIENLLREAVQDRHQNASGESRPGTVAEDKGAGEQLSPRQQKAMEKKRIKEEKAAARKAEKEAKKAEKAARKAARKAGKGDGAQGQGNAAGLAGGGSAAGTEEAMDTAFLDSILSEAGKINSAEAISSATGNYEAKVDNIIPDEDEAVPAEENTGSASSANNDLGIDLNNLFGGSAEAESAMMAGGDSDLEGFVSLDGGDMSGIIELGGGDEEESKPKKKGFFSRFLEFLTEEEEEEEENENIKLSEENQEIIEDLDKEKNKKDKKGKKGKKKVKKGDVSAEDGEESEDDEGKAGKKKKAKKPKKEKLPKEKEPVDPKNRLSLKKVLPIVLICLSLGIAIIITVFAFVDFTGNKAARDAYYDGDYQACYQYLYGQDMDETEQIMFGKSQSILTIQWWIREYEMLKAEGAELEALDSLIQSVNDYPVLYEYAGRWNAAGEVAQEYATILNLLYENYGLTEDQARAIAAEKSDIEYTRQVNAIVQGGAYGSWNEPEPEIEVPLQDELPEETELPQGSFIDTNTSVQ